MMKPVDHEMIAFNKLTGKYKHYCYEYDGLAIDESCVEFVACRCYDQTDQVKALQEKHHRVLESCRDGGHYEIL